MTETGNQPDLHLGDSGEWVTHLQQRLQGLSLYNGQIDGNYGETTDTAVRQLHEAAGISSGEGVSAQTWQVLLAQEQQAGITGYGQQGTGQDYGTGGYRTGEYGTGEYGSGGYGQQAGEGYSAGAETGSSGAAQLPAGQLSADGQWRWDGSEWRPAGQQQGAGTEGGAAAGAASQPAAAQDQGEKYTIEVNRAADDPSTEEAVLVA